MSDEQSSVAIEPTLNDNATEPSHEESTDSTDVLEQPAEELLSNTSATDSSADSATQESESTETPAEAEPEDKGKIALMVPPRPKAQETDSQTESTNPPKQQAVTKPAGIKQTKEQGQSESRKQSLPLPLQSLKPRQKPQWLKALQQPWFQRIQEKTLFLNISRSPKIHPNSILVACISALVIALQGYLNLSLPNLSVNTLNNVMSQLGISQVQFVESLPIIYNFQLPLALLSGAVLGSILGGFTVLVFLAIGLFATPIFANGGGLDYLYQPGFPFLAAMFIGTIFSGYFTKIAFSPKRTTRQALFLYGGGIMSTLITHGVGLIGLTILLTITSPFLAPAHPISSWWQWVIHLSLEPLPYDLMATCLFLWFTRYIRLSIYPALY